MRVGRPAEKAAAPLPFLGNGGRHVIGVRVQPDAAQAKASLQNYLKQLRYGAAVAATRAAKRVQAAERRNMGAVLDRPTPFTLNSVAVQPATRDSLTAVVYVRPIAARYLLPFEVGGQHVLNSKALLDPKNINLNRYGNLPRTKLRSLAARPDIFIGPVKTKSGVVHGVWQLPTAGKPGKAANRTGHLKLLIRFSDPQQVKQRLHYRRIGLKVAAAALPVEFRKAQAEALRTAKG